MAVWTSGLVAFTLRGTVAAFSYLQSVLAYGWLLYIPFMVFFFQYFHRKYVQEVRAFRPYLKIPDDAFTALLRRLDRLLTNPWVVFLLAALLTGYFELTNISVTGLQALLSEIKAGRLPTSDVLWVSGQAYLNWLLLTTAIWLVISIWVGVFLISRRPLNFTPARFSNEFRGLARLNLFTTGFYFLGLTIPGLLNLYLAASTTRTFDPLSLAFFYVLIIPGIIGFLAPHYNIHKTLLNSKQTELERIDKEIVHYAGKLHSLHLSDSKEMEEYVKLSARLIALQASERRIAEADDWPLDHSQITTFLILIIIPILLNLLTNPLP